MSTLNVDIQTALHRLRPGAVWDLNGNTYAGLNWIQDGQGGGKPTEQEVQAMLVTLQSEASAGETTDGDLRTKLNQAETLVIKIENNTATPLEQRQALASVMRILIRLFKKGILRL